MIYGLLTGSKKANFLYKRLKNYLQFWWVGYRDLDQILSATQVCRRALAS